MTRRSIFKFLAGLPLVGLFVSKVHPADIDVHGEEAAVWARASRKARVSQSTHTCNCTNTVEITDIVCPCKNSLNHRYEASDKTWTTGWLEDEVDPCTPDGRRHHWRCEGCGGEMWWNGP